MCAAVQRVGHTCGRVAAVRAGAKKPEGLDFLERKASEFKEKPPNSW